MIEIQQKLSIRQHIIQQYTNKIKKPIK